MTTEVRTQTFAIADPRTFDGDPYEVAERAALQAAALGRLLRLTTETARLMVRNADLERQLALDGDCDAAAFEEGAVARKIDAVIEAASEAEKQLTLVARAAAYNPKARIGR